MQSIDVPECLGECTSEILVAIPLSRDFPPLHLITALSLMKQFLLTVEIANRFEATEAIFFIP